MSLEDDARQKEACKLGQGRTSGKGVQGARVTRCPPEIQGAVSSPIAKRKSRCRAAQTNGEVTNGTDAAEDLIRRLSCHLPEIGLWQTIDGPVSTIYLYPLPQ